MNGFQALLLHHLQKIAEIILIIHLHVALRQDRPETRGI